MALGESRLPCWNIVDLMLLQARGGAIALPTFPALPCYCLVMAIYTVFLINSIHSSCYAPPML